MEDKITLRKIPYPYKAALAICSDLDKMNREKFDQIHDFLSSNKPTLLGNGLDLEIADSFWMYSSSSDTINAFSYFEGTSEKPSNNAIKIEEMISAGFIDSLHTYGDFSEYPAFNRSLAERALTHMKKNNLMVSVWINHGNIHNFQNIGIKTALGDLEYISAVDGGKRKCIEYHTDITLPFGFKYLWIDELTEIIGQERPCGIIEAAFSKLFGSTSTKSFSHRLIQAFVSFLLILQNKLSLKLKIKLALEKLFPKAFDGNNDLIKVITLRDGQKAYSFKRYGRFGVDNSDALPKLLSKPTLEKLEYNKGIMVLFVHLAKNNNRKDIFSTKTCDALRYLSTQEKSGHIYVTTTSKLLHYTALRKFLKWRAQLRSNAIEIVIEKVEDPVYGDYIPTAQQLQGISFYVPDAKKTSVSINGNKIPVNRNLPDFTGKESVTIPLIRLKYPNNINA
jgi:hypothetical protein